MAAETVVKSPSAELMILAPKFEEWLTEANVSLALTTYQRGRLFFIGRKPAGGIRAHERLIEQCQGLWSDGETLWVSSLYNLIRFQNVLGPGEVTASGRRPAVRTSRDPHHRTPRCSRHCCDQRGHHGHRRTNAANLHQHCLQLPGDS